MRPTEEAPPERPDAGEAELIGFVPRVGTFSGFGVTLARPTGADGSALLIS